MNWNAIAAIFLALAVTLGAFGAERAFGAKRRCPRCSQDHSQDHFVAPSGWPDQYAAKLRRVEETSS